MKTESRVFGSGGGEVEKSNIHAKKAAIDRQPEGPIAAYLKAMRDKGF